MRLLNTVTLKLTEFIGNDIPPYAILSHVWSSEEISYSDFKAGAYNKSAYGYQKIVKLCELAQNAYHDLSILSAFQMTYRYALGQRYQALEWCWIDTVCIDKSSSSELSEAINSMYKWYQRAAACFIFMPDVHPLAVEELGTDSENAGHGGVHLHKGSTMSIRYAAFCEREFRTSKWHTRGWTLQELVAPTDKVFFNSSYRVIGHIGIAKYNSPSFLELVSVVAGIQSTVLARGLTIHPYPDYEAYVCISQRMSWMRSRTTTREEDMSYCLLGIFNVNMPLLYGEGAEKAFFRLQVEIISKSQDQSIFAWSAPSKPIQVRTDISLSQAGLLAPNPQCFASCQSTGVEPFIPTLFTLTQRGIEVQLALPRGLRPRNLDEYYLMLPLPCYEYNDVGHRVYFYILLHLFNYGKNSLDGAIYAKRIERVQWLPVIGKATVLANERKLQKQALGWEASQFLDQLKRYDRHEFTDDNESRKTAGQRLRRCLNLVKPAMILLIYVEQVR